MAALRSLFPEQWPAWYRVAFVCGIAALVPLYLFDPETHTGFLACPTYKYLGLLCPGCGSQRALHDLLHGRIGEAFEHNALLTLAIPLLGTQLILPWLLGRKEASGSMAVVAFWGILIIGWTIYRNLLRHPHIQ